MKNLSIVSLIIAFAFALTGCATPKMPLDLNKVENIKSAALIMYTVPQDIIFDPKDGEPTGRDATPLGNFNSFATSHLNVNHQAYVDRINEKRTGLGNGIDAATIAYNSYLSLINEKQSELPFKFLSAEETLGNPTVKSLYVKLTEREPERKTKIITEADYMMSAPRGLNQFGFVAPTKKNPLSGKPEEAEYIMKIMEALNVDAALIVTDSQMAFSCVPCTFTKLKSGSATTKSTQTVMLVDRQLMPIVNYTFNFVDSGGRGKASGGDISEEDQAKLFKAHGEKAAKMFTGQLIFDMNRAKYLTEKANEKAAKEAK